MSEDCSPEHNLGESKRCCCKYTRYSHEAVATAVDRLIVLDISSIDYRATAYMFTYRLLATLSSLSLPDTTKFL